MQTQDRYDVIRLVSMIILWAALIVSVIAFITGEGVMPGWAILLALGALLGTNLVSLAFQRPVSPPLVEQHADSVRKRKNESAVSGDPMSLLTEEDIEELRAEFKDELRRRYLQGLDENASEPASFEALLEDRQQRKRR
jgi:hypothetical protein